MPAGATQDGAELLLVACDLAGHDKPPEGRTRIRVFLVNIRYQVWCGLYVDTYDMPNIRDRVLNLPLRPNLTERLCARAPSISCIYTPRYDASINLLQQLRIPFS